jgi:peptide/nickel transport system ATP-binding protein
LEIIPGMVPEARNFPSGCRFAPRCRLADERCRRQQPELAEWQPGHRAACWKAGQDGTSTDV